MAIGFEPTLLKPFTFKSDKWNCDVSFGIECNAATSNARTATADCVKVTNEVKSSVIIANNAASNAEAAANQVAVFLSGLEGKKLMFSGDGIVRWSNA